MPSLATFNANNLFLRYRFQGSYPGDTSQKSLDRAEEAVGFLPGRAPGGRLTRNFVVWDRTRRDVAATILAEPDGDLPDILCLQEIETLDALRAFNERALGGHYPYALLIDGHDERNIDVGLLSRFPVAGVRTHVDDRRDGDFVFSRDCLECEIELRGENLTLFLTHLKSKFTQAKTEAARRKERLAAGAKRRAEAEEIARIVRRRMDGRLGDALFAVVGDFNDVPASPYLAPLLGAPFLVDVLSTQGPPDCWTYYWRSKGQVSQIDHVLASRALSARIAAQPRRPHVERGGLGYRALGRDGQVLPADVTWTRTDEDHPDVPRVPADSRHDFRFERFDAVLQDVSNNASDHCPVKLWF